MNWDEDTINRIGMVVGFFSFWLAAPEVLGENRLRALETFLNNWGLKALHKRIKSAIFFVMVSLNILAALLLFLSSSLSVGTIVVIFVYNSVLSFIWGGRITAKTSDILVYYIDHIASAERTKQRALVISAILFTTSFLLQYLATYL